MKRILLLIILMTVSIGITGCGTTRYVSKSSGPTVREENILYQSTIPTVKEEDILPQSAPMPQEDKEFSAVDIEPRVDITKELSFYRVQKGDTLYSIAKHHGVKLKEIVDVNAIEDSSAIYVGQSIIIPEDQEN